MKHAKLSPSASSRWMTCPGSVHLEPDIKGGDSSIYAEKGTAMHTVSDLCLTKGLEPNWFHRWMQSLCFGVKWVKK